MKRLSYYIASVVCNVMMALHFFWLMPFLETNWALWPEIKPFSNILVGCIFILYALGHVIDIIFVIIEHKIRDITLDDLDLQ